MIKKILAGFLLTFSFLSFANNISYIVGEDEATGEECIVGFESLRGRENVDYIIHDEIKFILREDRNSRPQVDCEKGLNRFRAERGGISQIVSMCTDGDKVVSVLFQNFSNGNSSKKCINFK